MNRPDARVSRDRVRKTPVRAIHRADERRWISGTELVGSGKVSEGSVGGSGVVEIVEASVDVTVVRVLVGRKLGVAVVGCGVVEVVVVLIVGRTVVVVVVDVVLAEVVVVGRTVVVVVLRVVVVLGLTVVVVVVVTIGAGDE